MAFALQAPSEDPVVPKSARQLYIYTYIYIYISTYMHIYIYIYIHSITVSYISYLPSSIVVVAGRTGPSPRLKIHQRGVQWKQGGCSDLYEVIY